MLWSLPRFLCIFAVLSGLLPGCTTTPATPDQLEAPPDEIASVVDQGLVPVARYGRYTLVELVPEPAQRDLLQQVAEVSIPPMLDASVGDAMRHVLLRDALLTLAGPAWELSVDDVTRQVCFSRHGAPNLLSANPPGTAPPVPDVDRPEERKP
jgi:hypothetical protein